VRRSRSPSNCGKRWIQRVIITKKRSRGRTLICRWTRALMSVEQYWKSLSGWPGFRSGG
jgi:hypothetical protein